jgi:DNA-binding response OmpR family regulator
MNNRGQRILVIGKRSPLLEGVSDLLQLSGYKVYMSSNWAETENAMVVTPPNLAIVDLSNSASDAYSLSESLRNANRWAEVPILFISFSGDDRIRDLQRHKRNSDDGRLQFYSHTLLGVDGLVEKVKTCLS